jgi:hypothetical protein
MIWSWLVSSPPDGIHEGHNALRGLGGLRGLRGLRETVVAARTTRELER